MMQEMMSYIKWSLFSLAFLPSACSQNTTGVHVRNPDFDHRLSRILRFDVPVISVDSFYSEKEDFYILDTRTTAEYQVSHIRGAHFMNYSHPDFTLLSDVSKETPIVVYCSIGYRSEKIGEELQKMGFTHVFNLYGSIFEWVNEGHSVVDPQDQVTNKIHTYGKRWSQYVYNPEVTKTW